jgi:hypothetical protein
LLRKTIHAFAVSFAGFAIMLAIEGGALARSAGAISSSHPQMGHPSNSATASNWRGSGYGRGWCYWHPYVCYRQNQ